MGKTKNNITNSELSELQKQLNYHRAVKEEDIESILKKIKTEEQKKYNNGWRNITNIISYGIIPIIFAINIILFFAIWGNIKTEKVVSEDFKGRLESLEQRVKVLSNVKKDSLNPNDIQIAFYQTKDKLEAQIDKKSEKIKKQLDVLITWGIPLGLVSLVLALWSFYKQIKPQVVDIIQDRTEPIIKPYLQSLEKQTKENEIAFNKVLRNQAFLDETTETNRIMILYDDKKALNDTKKILLGMGFRKDNIESCDITDVANIELEEFHNKLKDFDKHTRVDEVVNEQRLSKKELDTKRVNKAITFVENHPDMEKIEKEVEATRKKKNNKELEYNDYRNSYEKFLRTRLISLLKHNLSYVLQIISKYDIIIFDEHTAELKHFENTKKDNIWETCIVDEETSTLYIYFGSGRSNTKNKYSDMVQAANTAITLPPRINELLFFQRLSNGGMNRQF